MNKQNMLLKNGKSFIFVDEADVFEGSLPVGYYSLDIDAKGNAKLTEKSELSFPEKIYNVDSEFRKRVISSFNHYNKNLGCLLTGSSGTGKTMTAKLITKEINLPVVLIDKPIQKNFPFGNFINNINFDCVFFFDEFEKNFDSYRENDSDFLSQADLLSVLDGVNSSNKKLFLFTTNNSVNDYLMNRPSRIKYAKSYKGISDELVKVIIEDKLQNKDLKEDLLENIDKNTCTIDILCSILEEVNLHNIPFSTFKSEFNYNKNSNIHIIALLSNDNKFKEIVKTDFEINNLTRLNTLYIDSLNVVLKRIDGTDVYPNIFETTNGTNTRYAIYRSFEKYVF